MHANGKKATLQESRKSPFSNAESGSVLISSLKLKKGLKVCHRKSNLQKTKCCLKKIISNRSNLLAVDRLSKCPRNDSRSRKLICQNVLKKAHEKKSSKKLVSSKLRWKHSAASTSREEGQNSNSAVKKCNRGKKKRRKKDMAELDEPSRLQRRARYLMIKMKLEQNLIDAYSGEGWKGQSREKIKPEKELLRAKKQILNCKLRLRDTIHQLDLLSKVGCIEDSLMAPDGSVCHEHIFCAKCKSNEVFQDNDIVLCDGMCNCAFHQKCLDPPLHTENIPPGDQGWFCKFCECRMEIIEAMNAHLGTQFSMNCNWQDIFKEEAAFPDDGNISLNPEEEWPSDDSEDDDYDPEKRENSMSGAGTDDDASNDANCSTSSGWSTGSELFPESGGWDMENVGFPNHSKYSSVYSDETSEGEIICGRRQRRAVDYKKLYDEMFGKDPSAHEQVTEDEDWGPGKRKRREKESDAASTLMTLYKSEKKGKTVDSADTVELKRKEIQDSQIRRQFFRMPSHAVEKLREVFAENELPSRTVKENLSKELGLDPGKVSKWFKNARYLALKTRKADGAEQPDNSVKIKTADSTLIEDAPTEARLCTSKMFKKVHQKNRPKLMGSSLKENEQDRSSFGTPEKSIEICSEYSDDMSLKRLLKTKTEKTKKRVNFVSTRTSVAAEDEMERLCRAKTRLENMMQALMKLQNNKGRKLSKKYLVEEPVIYIPVAELREKV